MSDTQRDREERQHVIEVLQNMVDWMEAINYIVATPERRHALDYAIASIKTDLKYDLLYEETSGQADKPTTKNDKVDCKHTDCKNCVNHKYCDYESNCSEIPTGSTTKNNLAVDCISRQFMYELGATCIATRNEKTGNLIALGAISELPSVTPQLSSGLEKNSKKLEKDFDESDCISRQAVDRLVWECLRKETDETIAFYENFLDLPSVTPIRPKGRWIGHREHCENLGVMPSGLGAYEWCSNCDCGIDVREWHRNHYNYCPNCGSDNREVEE